MGIFNFYRREYEQLVQAGKIPHVRSLIFKMHATELEDWETFGKIRQAEEKRLRVNQTFCSGKDHARRSDLALRRRFIGWPVLPAKGDAATEISHSRTTTLFLVPLRNGKCPI